MGSLLVQLQKSPGYRLTAEMIAGSDEGSDTNPFADLDKDKYQTEKN